MTHAFVVEKQWNSVRIWPLWAFFAFQSHLTSQMPFLMEFDLNLAAGLARGVMGWFTQIVPTLGIKKLQLLAQSIHQALLYVWRTTVQCPYGLLDLLCNFPLDLLLLSWIWKLFIISFLPVVYELRLSAKIFLLLKLATTARRFIYAVQPSACWSMVPAAGQSAK